MIRPATVEDIPRLLEMGEAFHAESGWVRFAAYDADSWEGTLHTLVEQEIGRILVWDNGGVRGFICGYIMPLYFNRSVTVAHELLWWVEPEHRTGAGAALLSAFHRGADLGCQTVSETTPRHEAVGRSLKMKGWTPTERVFMKELS